PEQQLPRWIIHQGSCCSFMSGLARRCSLSLSQARGLARPRCGSDHQGGDGMTTATGLESLKGTGTILLTTCKRDGTPVPTPVSIAFDGDRAFFRSYDQAWKTKRLRNNPHVEVAASTLRGRRTGPVIHARATLLEDGQASVAATALARRHRLLQGLL